jgi:hypothetical protein
VSPCAPSASCLVPKAVMLLSASIVNVVIYFSCTAVAVMTFITRVAEQSKSILFGRADLLRASAAAGDILARHNDGTPAPLYTHLRDGSHNAD